MSRTAWPILAACLALLSVRAAGREASAASEKVPGQKDRARKDRYGDALPPRAVARLGSLRLRSRGHISHAAFSPDGRKLAVVSCWGSSLEFWDVATGARERSFRTNESWVRGLAWPARQTVALAASSGALLVDVVTGKVRRRFSVPGQDGHSVALSPDGKLLAAGFWKIKRSQESALVLWDVNSGKELARLNGHKSEVTAVSFSPDGKQLFSSGQDEDWSSSVCIWEVSTGKLRRRFTQEGREVRFAPDGRRGACRHGGDQLLLFDLPSGRVRARLQGVSPCVFLPDGKTLVTGKYLQTLAVRDMDGRKLRSFRGRLGTGTTPIALSPDGQTLASVSESLFDPAVRLWDVGTGTERCPVGGHREAITCLAFSPDGKVLITGSKDHTVRVWDTVSGKELRVYAGHRHPIGAVACSPDGKVVASGDTANVVHLWDRATGALLHRLSVDPLLPGTEPWPYGFLGVTFLAFAPDGRTLHTGSEALLLKNASYEDRDLIAMWDPATGRKLRSIRKRECWPVAITPDGKRAVLQSSRGDLLYCDLDADQTFGRTRPLAEPWQGGAGFFARILSHDGRFLATGREGPLEFGHHTYHTSLHEIATGKKVLELEGADGVMAFRPDGRVLAVAAYRSDLINRINLASTATGRKLGELSGHFGRVTCSAFSPDGRRLATAGSAQVALIWDVTGIPPDKPSPLADQGPQAIERMWDELAGHDAGRAYRAGWALAADPARSVPLLRSRLKPASGASAATIDALIRKLDGNVFRTREQAAVALEKVGEQAIPALRRVLRSNPSLELRRRAEPLLARILTQLKRPLSREQLRLVRAVTVLERIGTTEARRTLQALAQGAPGALLTEEAQAALERLKRLR